VYRVSCYIHLDWVSGDGINELSVSVKRQPTHIQAHLVLPDTQSPPHRKTKRAWIFSTHGRQK